MATNGYSNAYGNSEAAPTQPAEPTQPAGKVSTAADPGPAVARFSDRGK